MLIYYINRTLLKLNRYTLPVVCGTSSDDAQTRNVRPRTQGLFNTELLPFVALPEFDGENKVENDVSLRMGIPEDPGEKETLISCGSILMSDRFILTAAHCEEQFS